MPTDIDTIVFSGGGVLGCAYLGAIKALEEKGMIPNFKNFIGTSVGGLYAFALACGRNSEDISKVISSTNFKTLLDEEWAISFPYKIWKDYGYHSGKKLDDWIRNIVRTFTGDPNITFIQLYRKMGGELNSNIHGLVLTGTNLTTKSFHVFSHLTDPEMPVYEALRITTRIPLLFEPIKYGTLFDGSDLYWVDGGVFNKFPLDLGLEISPNILGLHLKNRTVKEPIYNVYDFYKNTIECLMSNDQSHGRYKYSIDIDCVDISFANFDITEKEMDDLVRYGYQDVKKYLDITF